MVLIVVVARTMQQSKPELAIAELLESRAVVSVDIKPAKSRGLAIVNIGSKSKHIVSCDVEILGDKVVEKARLEQAAWIIITKPEPILADNGHNRDLMDVVCLF